LRSFIRGRAIECEAPPGGGPLEEATFCFVAGRDIAAWLVSQGWAEEADALYEDAEAAAREAGLGLWGGQRPELHADAATRG
jgi:endonuclease YncB( thermonuclease family)